MPTATQAKFLPPFAALRAFESVGRLRAARRAALELNISINSVTRHLRALEDWAGVKLFKRPSSALLTPEGEVYHRQVSAALEEISQAGLELTQRIDDGRLRIWCSPGLAYRWLSGKLSAFTRDNPDLDVEMRPTDHEPDFSRLEADADIRYVRDGAAPANLDLTSLEILRPRMVAVASPTISRLFSATATAAALLDTPLLHEADDSEWRAWLMAHDVSAPGRLSGDRFWHAHLVLDAAVRGQGVALTFAMLVEDELIAGRLSQLEFSPRRGGVRLGAYVLRVRRDRADRPSIRRFRTWLEQAVAQVAD